MATREVYRAGYVAASEDVAAGIKADRICTACHAPMTGKDRSCPLCSGESVKLSDSESLWAQGYLDRILGYTAAFCLIFALSGSAFAQGNSPNGGAGDDTFNVEVDSHTEHTVTEDHSVETSTDNSTSDDHSIGGDLRIEAAKGLKHRAASAANVVALSSPLASPCGDSTGLSVQTGIAGGGLATITEACRAYRTTQLLLDERVPRSMKIAAKVSYWAGFPARLVLTMVSGGALN